MFPFRDVFARVRARTELPDFRDVGFGGSWSWPRRSRPRHHPHLRLARIRELWEHSNEPLFPKFAADVLDGLGGDAQVAGDRRVEGVAFHRKRRTVLEHVEHEFASSATLRPFV